MNRYALTDEQWARLVPVLPPQKPATGHPAEDHRRILNGILWILRTGAPWRDLPAHFGPVGTVSSRFYRWRKAGIWERLLAALQTEADAAGEVDWQEHFVDGTVVRAHQHAAGAKPAGPATPTEPADHALGRSQGGFSTKVHLRVDGKGKPITFVLTPGQRHEAVVFEALMEQGAIKRPRRGRPRRKPKRVCGDKGYSSQRIRRYARRKGIRQTIPRRRNEKQRGPFDREVYRRRNVVERCINRLKQFRRVATRYEKRAENYLAMLILAAIMLWL
jgi:transposase